MPKGGVLVKGHVTARKRDREGNPVGHANDNPILDTRSYIVNFDDGDQTELTANMIAESLYSQCDPAATNMSYWRGLLTINLFLQPQSYLTRKSSALMGRPT
jgi:hypothetical protein